MNKSSYFSIITVRTISLAVMLVILGVLAFVPRTALYGAECCNNGIPGADMMHFNRSMESFSLGGASSGLAMNGGNVLVNPSLASTMLQQMVMINLGYGTENIHYLNSAYLHPTEYGVFGGTYSHFVDIGSKEYMFSVGPSFAKEINKKIALGAIIYFDYYLIDQEVPTGDRNPFGFNVSLAVSMRQDWAYEQWFLVFKNFIASAQIDQAGLVPWQKNQNGKQVYLKSMDILKLGAGFDFMEAMLPDNEGKWVSRLVADFSLTYPINFSYHVGWKNSFLFDHGNFKEFYFSLGNYIDPIVTKTFPLTGGIGTSFMIDDTHKMDIHYAFGLKYRSGIESYHSLGFNIYFGDVDNIEPQISSSLGQEGVIETGVIE